YKAVTLRDALNHPAIQRQLSVMFVAGNKDTKTFNETKKLHKSLEAHHPKVSEDKDERQKNQDLFFVQLDTSLSGTKLLAPPLGVREAIGTFLDWRLVKHKTDLQWQDRTNPLR